MKYEFSLILNQIDVSDDQVEAFYQSGCDDGSVLSRGDVTMIQFDREAANFDEALVTAIRDVEKSGLVVARVEIDRREAPQSA